MVVTRWDQCDVLQCKVPWEVLQLDGFGLLGTGRLREDHCRRVLGGAGWQFYEKPLLCSPTLVHNDGAQMRLHCRIPCCNACGALRIDIEALSPVRQNQARRLVIMAALRKALEPFAMIAIQCALGEVSKHMETLQSKLPSLRRAGGRGTLNFTKRAHHISN